MKEYANITNKEVDPFMNLSFVSLAVINMISFPSCFNLFIISEAFGSG